MNRIRNLQTMYAHGPMLYETNKIQLKPSSNCKVVKVKTDRVCAECGSKISKGDSCYTINPRVGADIGFVSLAYQPQMLRKLVKLVRDKVWVLILS